MDFSYASKTKIILQHKSDIFQVIFMLVCLLMSHQEGIKDSSTRCEKSLFGPFLHFSGSTAAIYCMYGSFNDAVNNS
jgi:hypothetical protein